jgi:hypothetical protein
MRFKIGDKVRVEIPVGALNAYPWADADAGWRESLRHLNGEFEVTSQRSIGLRKFGYHISSFFNSWVPEIWLVPLQIHIKTPCDCQWKHCLSKESA